jgi:hypothetical protein
MNEDETYSLTTSKDIIRYYGSPAICFRGARFSEKNGHLERSPNFSLGQLSKLKFGLHHSHCITTSIIISNPCRYRARWKKLEHQVYIK